MFPAETIPDGSVAWPHHFALGLYLVVIAAVVALNDIRTTDPLGVLAGVGVGLFGWFHLWGPGYPVAGALATFLGVLAAGIAVVRSISIPVVGIQVGIQVGGFRSRYGRGHAAVVLVGLVVAFDDWVSHAFGIWTPLDWIWGGRHLSRDGVAHSAISAPGIVADDAGALRERLLGSSGTAGR